MSNLRILSIVVGMALLPMVWWQVRYRAWRVRTAIWVGFTASGLMLVGFSPDSIGWLTAFLAFDSMEWGRLQTVLVVTCALNVYLVLSLRGQLDRAKSRHETMTLSLLTSQAAHESIPAGSIAVLLPAFNEGPNLKTLIPAIPAEVCGRRVFVYVLDDGSSDDTAQVARSSGARVISAPVNCGQGFALRMGYQFLRLAKPFEFGVTMDADNQHLPSDLPGMLAPVVRGDCDLVVGSRRLNPVQPRGSFLRSVGIMFFSRILLLLTGRKITDCSNGFKAFNRKWLDNVFPQENQFQAAEVLLRTAWQGLRISEVPVTVNKRDFGESKKGNDWAYGWNFARSIFRTLLRR